MSAAAEHLAALAAVVADSLAALPWPAVVAWLAIVATAAAHEYAPAPRRRVN